MGAWIETALFGIDDLLQCVAPHVGAWIETPIAQSAQYRAAGSHPMWVRGLKHIGHKKSLIRHSRTPCGCVD